MTTATLSPVFAIAGFVLASIGFAIGVVGLAR